MGNRRVRKDEQKHFFSNRVMDLWSKTSEEEVNAAKTWELKSLFDVYRRIRDEVL